jgi:hypothetical protein
MFADIYEDTTAQALDYVREQRFVDSVRMRGYKDVPFLLQKLLYLGWTVE